MSINSIWIIIIYFFFSFQNDRCNYPTTLIRKNKEAADAKKSDIQHILKVKNNQCMLPGYSPEEKCKSKYMYLEYNINST